MAWCGVVWTCGQAVLRIASPPAIHFRRRQITYMMGIGGGLYSGRWAWTGARGSKGKRDFDIVSRAL